MATGLPGWYPDPAGARGRFRYWDGAQWSTGTIDDPHQAPPAQPDQPLLTLPTSKSPQGLPRKRRLAVIIGVLAVVLTAVVAAAVFASGPRQAGNASAPTSTPTGLDDSSPT